VKEYKSARRGWLTDSVGSIDPETRTHARVRALEQMKAWTRERFTLAPGAAISVSELACSLPGCPPLETVIGFWIGERHHHFKVFKPLEEVTLDDFPYAWLRDALAVPEGYDCNCC
jgi:nitrate reductase delta subunit